MSPWDLYYHLGHTYIRLVLRFVGIAKLNLGIFTRQIVPLSPPTPGFILKAKPFIYVRVPRYCRLGVVKKSFANRRPADG